MDGDEVFGRDSKRTKEIKSYKEQESHDSQRPEEIRHIEEVTVQATNFNAQGSIHAGDSSSK